MMPLMPSTLIAPAASAPEVHITYTGGTIGMVESPHGLIPGADLDSWLAELLEGTALAGRVSLTVLDPLIDSANATPESWQAIIDDLRAHRAATPADGADGINGADGVKSYVVLHGTDTMAYTSAALSYALTGFGKPVVMTGAQYPLGVVGTDAAPNVTGALRAATSGKVGGVAVFFGHKLLAGARVTKTSSWSYQGFDSPAVPALAFTGAPWQWMQPAGGATGWPDPAPYRRHDVLVLDLVPGVTAARLAAALDPPPEAVVLRAFGTGNVPSEEPGLTDLLARTIASGVPIAVASQCVQAEVLLGHYEAGYALAQSGAIGAHDMTLEALYAKLVFLLCQGLSGTGLVEAMDRNIAGELTTDPDQPLTQ